MLCKECGKEIEDTSKFCKYCGARILEQTTFENPSTETSPLSSLDARQKLLCDFENSESEKKLDTDSINEKADINYYKNENQRKLSFVAKIALMFALIFFFCPFVMISCGGESTNISGIELMIAYDIGEERTVEDEPINAFLLVAFFAGVCGLIEVFDRKVNVFFIILALGSMILFRMTFFQYYKIEEYKNSGIIQFKWGWMLSLGTFIIALLCQFLREFEENKK